MSLDIDLILDRRRLKRRLLLWRVVAVLAVAACAIVLLGKSGLPSANHVARIRITGVITDSTKLTDAITAVAKDDTAKALIVAIDSPGGSVSGGEALHGAIAKVAAVKPVVAVMGGTAASAGYMIAMPAQRVFAREGTLTGSIGVIMETGEISGLLEKLGITATQLVSGPLKGQPSLTAPLSPAGKDMLQGLISDYYDQFVTMVAIGRHMTPDAVRALADGRPYTGRQALKLHLIDAIGGESDARDWLQTERQVPADLAVQDVSITKLNQLLGDSAGSFLKDVFPQLLTLDGPVALWQPSRQVASP